MKKKTTAIIVISILLLFSIIGLGVSLFSSGKFLVDETLPHRVTVSGGTAVSEDAVLRFDVARAGTYMFRTKWNTVPGGLITGLTITDSKDNIVFACTAESLMAEFDAIRLKKGTYTVSFQPITSIQEFLRFMEKCGIALLKGEDDAEISISEYVYAEDGTWDMEYLLQAQKAPLSFVNAGILTGILVGLLLAALFLLTNTTDTSTRRKYDERQLLAQRTAYQYSFFTMTGFSLLMLCWYLAGFPSFIAQPEVLLFLDIILGTLVYAVYAIWNDAYFALNENRNRLIVCFATLGSVNLILAARGIHNGGMLTDGKLNFLSLSLFCGILSITALITILLKKQKEKRDEDE